MKKAILVTLVTVTLFSCKAFADDDKMVQFEALPTQVKEFVNTHFKGVGVAYAKEERETFVVTGYEVMFTTGEKVEFDRTCAWEEVDCKYSAVPASVIPAQIKDFVAQKHPDAKIVKIERDRWDYEVELNIGLELKFDLQFNLIGYDS